MAEDDSKIRELEAELKKLKKKPSAGSELDYLASLSTLKSEITDLKKKLKGAVKQHGIFKAIVEELNELIVPLEPIERPPSLKEGKGIVEHFVMHLSDEHADEIVLPTQTGGLEAFDFNIALCRAETYIDSLIDWKNNLSNHTFPVLHILSNGDHTSGEIHGATTRSHYRNMFKNCLAIGQMQALMIRDLAPHFPVIKVYCLSGNHGRRTPKKDFHGAHDNYDYLISEIAKLHCADLKNVEFTIPDAYSMNIEINGHGFGVEHGDGIKSWMGIPFYGLERKTRRLVALHNTFDKKISYFVFGHFHTMSSSADLKGEMIINGAWPATNAYSFESFSGYREPMQLIHGVHQKHGVTWRMPIKLKDVEREKRGPQRYKSIQFDQ